MSGKVVNAPLPLSLLPHSCALENPLEEKIHE